MGLGTRPSGGGGGVTLPGSAKFYSGSGDPTLAVSAEPDSYYWDTAAAKVWIHGKSGTNNWDWVNATDGIMNPRTIFGANCVWWGELRFGEGVGYDLDGVTGNVENVYDLSASGLDLAQTTDADQPPLLATGGPNGTPALDLGDASGDWMLTPIAPSPIISIGDRPTMIVWGRITANRWSMYLSEAGVGVRMVIGSDVTNNLEVQAEYDAGLGSTLFSDAFTADGARMFTLASGTNLMSQSGVPATTTGSPAAGWTAGEDINGDVDRMIVGHGSDGGGRWAAAVVLDRVPTAAEVLALSEYSQAHYALPLTGQTWP